MTKITNMLYLLIVLILLASTLVLRHKYDNAVLEAQTFQEDLAYAQAHPKIVRTVDTIYREIISEVLVPYGTNTVDTVYIDTNRYFKYTNVFSDSLIDATVISYVAGNLVSQTLKYNASIPEITRTDSITITSPPEYIRTQYNGAKLLAGGGLNSELNGVLSGGVQWEANQILYSYVPSVKRHGVTYLRTFNLKRDD